MSPCEQKKFYKMREENPFIIKWHFRSHNLSECQTVTNWQKRTFSSTEMQFNTNPWSSKFELFSHNFPKLPRAVKKLNFLQKLYLKRNKSRQKVKRRGKKRRNNFSFFLFILFDEAIRKIASPIVFNCVLWSGHWWTGEIMPLMGTEAKSDLKV